MRVNEKVVLDIETGAIVERVAREYFGPVEKCEGRFNALEAQTSQSAVALAATQIFTGVIPTFQHYTLGTGGALTITLQTPVAGAQVNGGDDGKIAMFSTLTAQAHVVQTAANKIQTNKITATSSAAIGNFIMLVANGGFWWPVSNLNFTLA